MKNRQNKDTKRCKCVKKFWLKQNKDVKEKTFLLTPSINTIKTKSQTMN